IQRQHDQRQRSVFRQQFAANDLVAFDGLDEFVVVGALRQLGGKQRRRQFAGRRRLPRREQRNDAAGPVDELQIGDEIAQFFQIVSREQGLAFDDDEYVEFLRRELFGDLFVLAV